MNVHSRPIGDMSPSRRSSESGDGAMNCDGITLYRPYASMVSPSQ
jgi:hypothetical protein